MELTVSVSDDGDISFKDEAGNPVSEEIIGIAKKQQGQKIRDLIASKCDEINSAVESLGLLHIGVPNPKKPLSYVERAFEVPFPSKPIPKRPNLLQRFLPGKRKALEERNELEALKYDENCREWEIQKRQFEKNENLKADLVRLAHAGRTTAMETFLSELLQDIEWPRETAVSFEVEDDGKLVAFDVDLPEVEEMPTKTASVPQRGYRLSVKEMSDTKIRRLYANHIHSLALRIIGETFGMLPTVESVTFSGYSQRRSKETAQLADEYLLSVRARRSDWEEIDFSSLESLDPVQALDRFELRRSLTKTGIFKSIDPF